jgi:hypothetical protein
LAGQLRDTVVTEALRVSMTVTGLLRIVLFVI